METDTSVMVYQTDHHLSMVDTFKSYLDEDMFVDLIFICRDNKRVGAHQLVFGSISGMFLQLIAENSRSSREKILHVNIPEIRSRILKRILEFIYIGKAQLYRGELEEFSENLKLLGLPLNFPNFDPRRETSEFDVETVDLTTSALDQPELIVHDLENSPTSAVTSSNNVSNEVFLLPEISPSVSDIAIENSTEPSFCITSSNENSSVRSSSVTSSNLCPPPDISDSLPSVSNVACSSPVQILSNPSSPSTMLLPIITSVKSLASEASKINSDEEITIMKSPTEAEKPPRKRPRADSDSDSSLSMIHEKRPNRTNNMDHLESSQQGATTESINLDSDDE